MGAMICEMCGQYSRAANPCVWCCGGATMQTKIDSSAVKRMASALERIAKLEDSYNGHRCLMCRVREIAREGLKRE